MHVSWNILGCMLTRIHDYLHTAGSSHVTCIILQVTWQACTVRRSVVQCGTFREVVLLLQTCLTNTKSMCAS